MMTFDKRRRIGSKLNGTILPSVLNQLNVKSRNIGRVSISRSSDTCAEVSGMRLDGTSWGHVVELVEQKYTCRE
jgi:hypothetical protein